MFGRLFGAKKPPIEQALPKPSAWPSHSSRAEARIARLMHAIRKYKSHDPNHPKLAALRVELGLLTGVKVRTRDGVVIDVPSKNLNAKG